jgi:hypothetical protein
MKKSLIVFIITLIIFLLLEFSSWIVLKYHYRNYAGLENILKFKLFSLKYTFKSPIELSTYYSFRFKSNIKKNNENNFPTTIYKGLLDEKYDNVLLRPPLKNNNTFDIYLFGGSTIYLESKDNETIGKHINIFLDEKKCKNKDFRVLVAGHSGYHSINQINRLVSDVLYLQPEYVIFFDGINDFIHSHHNQNWEINDTIHQNSYRNLYNIIDGESINLENFFQELPMRFYSTYLFNKIFKKISGITLIKNKTEKQIINQIKQREMLADKNIYNSEGAINYIQNHKILKSLSNSFNFKTLHVLQPTLANDIRIKVDGYKKVKYQDYFPDPEKILTSKQKKKVSDYWFNNMIKFYDEVETKFNNLNDNPNNRFVSFSKIFKQENNLNYIYYDSIHYKDKYAINVISKLISNEIINHLGCDSN